MRNIGLYVHIPFCRQRCSFCAFYLEVARTERIDAFCQALEQELYLYREHDRLFSRPLTTIYFGGGTPTAIPVTKLIATLDLIRSIWPTHSTAEITIEAHPSTVSADTLHALIDAGFNRISFGAESMNERDFGAIGRPGTVGDTNRAVAEAREAGFTNINLDLMYGLPGQSLASWTDTLEAVLSLQPSHVSCYALTIEEGTKLAHDIARKVVKYPDESLQIDMESAAEAHLAAAGYTRYEISNYAKAGSACRHNLLYWTDQDYVGLGPSAQSYVDGVRFGDVADLTVYMDLLARRMLPHTERTELSPSQQQREALVFGLRLIDGVPWSAVGSSASPAVLERLFSQGLIESTADRVKLTPLGQRYADSVAEQLF